MTLTPPDKQTSAGRVADWAALLSRLGPLIGLAFVFALFAILRFESFLNVGNIELILRQTAVVGTAALGMTLIIVVGGIDLSVGSAIALCTVVIALVLPHQVSSAAGGLTMSRGLPPWLAALAGIGAGAMCGLAIGAMVVGHVGRVFAAVFGLLAFMGMRSLLAPGWFGVVAAIAAGVVVAGACIALNETFIRRLVLAPFIVTLGMWGALRGTAKGLADNSMVYPAPSWLNALLKPLDADHPWLLTPGAWLMLFLAVVVAAMLRYARLGRHIFAIGSNEQTARLCGVNVERTKILLYTLAGAFTGLAGLLQFSHLTMGDPTTAIGMELDVIAAVVIGGASLSGGQGSVLGSLVGALIMTVVSNGCTKMGWANWVQEIVTGGIIVFAVGLDRLRQRRLS